MKINIMWNRNQKNQAGSSKTNDMGRSVGQQIADSIHRMKEERNTNESESAYAARVYAKAQAGKKLTPSEMSFLARTNPALYQKVLRAQAMRKALENQLKSCRSRQEAAAVFAAAVRSISKNDPDRDMLVGALTEAYKEFTESQAYKNLPEKAEGDEAAGGNGLEYQVNDNGYQEIYVAKERENSFLANG